MSSAAGETLYLRNVILQYIMADEPDVRARMEAAIAAVLRFSPAELQALQVRCSAHTSHGRARRNCMRNGARSRHARPQEKRKRQAASWLPWARA